MVNTALQKGQKSTQRDRLVTGMIAAANGGGYASANVSAVIAAAGVSRPTFYDYFADRDDCFLAVLAEVTDALLEHVRGALENSGQEPAARRAVAALISFASTYPAMARFLMNESLAAGADALAARDRAVAELAQLIEDAENHSGRDGGAPDIPLGALVGACQRVLGSRLRRGLLDSDRVRDELAAWLSSYERPKAEHRWRALTPAGAAPTEPIDGVSRLQAPPPLGPGRPRLSPIEVAENHRQRLLFAASTLATEQGYTATTVAEVTERAGLDRRAFYAIFPDKRELFMALHEFGFQRLLAVSAGAFFSGTSWPQRIFNGLRGLTGYLEANPAIAHVGFIEAYAVGQGAIQRVEDSVSAFAVFLHEGYRYEPRASPPSPLALEAIISCIFEIVYQEARKRARPRLLALSANMSSIALTPFLGISLADQLIDAELAAG